MKKIKLVSIIFCLLLSLSCTKRAKVFTVQIIGEVPSADWTLATDAVSGDLLYNIMEGLTAISENLDAKPGLAESWKISPDGKTYIFKLRAGVKWSDGQPLKAQQFVDAWRRLVDPATGAEYAYFLGDIENGADITNQKKPPESLGVRAIDDLTLEVKLIRSASYFLHLVSCWGTFPVRLDIINKYGLGKWTEPGNIVTLGPYLMTEWKHDDSLMLKANPNYYGSPPPIKEVKFIVVSENSTAVSLFETGQIDIVRAEIPPVDLPRYAGKSVLKIAPWLRMYYYGFNVDRKPFTDPRVRKAFAHAVDRSIFPKILKAQQIPSTSWIPKGLQAANESVGLEFNPEKAKKLLKEAGYPNGEGFPVNDIYMMYDSREENKIVAETLQSQWKEHLNVQVPIQSQEWKVYLKLLNSKDCPFIFRMGWGADYPDPDNFMNLFLSYSANNNTKWKSAEFDKMILSAAGELDTQKRIATYNKAQKLMLEDDAIIIPLFQQAIVRLINDRVKKVSINSMDNLYLKDWSL